MQVGERSVRGLALIMNALVYYIPGKLSPTRFQIFPRAEFRKRVSYFANNKSLPARQKYSRKRKQNDSDKHHRYVWNAAFPR